MSEPGERPPEPISGFEVLFWTVIFVPFGIVAACEQVRQRERLERWKAEDSARSASDDEA